MAAKTSAPMPGDAGRGVSPRACRRRAVVVGAAVVRGEGRVVVEVGSSVDAVQ